MKDFNDLLETLIIKEGYDNIIDTHLTKQPKIYNFEDLTVLRGGIAIK